MHHATAILLCSYDPLFSKQYQTFVLFLNFVKTEMPRQQQGTIFQKPEAVLQTFVVIYVEQIHLKCYIIALLLPFRNNMHIT